jgi:glycosyltransferase involved in cell wall biosynthesis
MTATMHDNPTATRPTVSVIIPTRNRSRLLRNALDSVEAQEGRGDVFDLEVLVVDDASVDDTPDVVRRYPSVRYIRLETNQGPAAARNRALRGSTGAYVALLDDDDSYLPHRLRIHVEALEANPEYGAVYGQLQYEGEPPYPEASAAPSGRIFRALLMKEWIYTNVVTIRREALSVAGLFDEQLPTMEHHDFFLRLALHVPFLFMPDVVARCTFSSRGFWFSGVCRGAYQRAIPIIVDRALAMLSPSEPVDDLRLAARAAWFPTIAYWLEQAGAVERLREHVISSLTADARVLTEPDALFPLHASRAASAIATSSPSPIQDVRRFCAELERAACAAPWLARCRLMARAWLVVARALAGLNRPAEARRAAIETIRHYPVMARHPEVLGLIAPWVSDFRVATPAAATSPLHSDPLMAATRVLTEDARAAAAELK